MNRGAETAMSSSSAVATVLMQLAVEQWPSVQYADGCIICSNAVWGDE